MVCALSCVWQPVTTPLNVHLQKNNHCFILFVRTTQSKSSGGLAELFGNSYAVHSHGFYLSFTTALAPLSLYNKSGDNTSESRQRHFCDKVTREGVEVWNQGQGVCSKTLPALPSQVLLWTCGCGEGCGGALSDPTSVAVTTLAVSFINSILIFKQYKLWQNMRVLWRQAKETEGIVLFPTCDAKWTNLNNHSRPTISSKFIRHVNMWISNPHEL